MKFSINQPQNHFEISLSTPSKIKCSLDKTWVEQDFPYPPLYPRFATFKQSTGWQFDFRISSLLDNLISETFYSKRFEHRFWLEYNKLFEDSSSLKPGKYIKSDPEDNKGQYIYGSNAVKPSVQVVYSLLKSENDWSNYCEYLEICNYANGKQIEEYLFKSVEEKFQNIEVKKVDIQIVLKYDSTITYFCDKSWSHNFKLQNTRLIFNIFQIWRRLTCEKLKSGLKVNHKHPQSLISGVRSLENESVIKRLQGSRYNDGEWELVDPNKAHEVWRFPIFTLEQIQSFKDRAYELKRLRS